MNLIIFLILYLLYSLGYSQNYIGGSAVDWIHQHDVQHHVNTNDVTHDPDIVGGLVLRLNPLKPLLFNHALQHLYVFILIGFFGFTIIQYSIENVWKGEHHIPMSPLIKSYRMFDLFTSVLFIFRWFILPLILKPTIWTLINIAPMFIVGGYYLAFFFLISHNYKGAYFFDEKNSSLESIKNSSFLYTQVTSASNVGGPWLCFMNGGLNYQIEHHLFPRIQHCHYPKIAPLVRSFCKEKNIPYIHFPTIYDNFKSTVEHLMDMGNKQEPVKISAYGTSSK